MKKILFALTFILPIGVNSQITISKADMPNVNDTLRVSIINGPNSIDPENTGANYTWDFSGLQFEIQKIDSFVSVGSTPWGYQIYFNNPLPDPWGYPEHYSSYATPIDPPPTYSDTFQIDKVFYFFKESTDQYSQTGFGAQLNGLPISQRYIPVDVIYEFPLDFGNTSSCTSTFGFLIPDYGYYGRTTERNNTVDGWGDLTTPFGTFQTLRVKSVLDITDTLYSDSLQQGFLIPRPTEIEYKWLASGKGIPLLQINANDFFGFPVISRIVYRDSVRMDIVGIKNTISNDSDFKIFPNPNNGKFQLTIDKQLLKTENIFIRNIMGEIIFSSRVSEFNPHFSFDFQNGIYFLQIGSRIQKLIVNY